MPLLRPAEREDEGLRKSLYIVVEADGHRFRPESKVEHFPRRRLAEYQAGHGGRGSGAGRELELGLVCYAPEPTGAAEEGRRLMEEALEELRSLTNLSGFSRDAVAARYRSRYDQAIFRAAFSGACRPAYRPPPTTLPPCPTRRRPRTREQATMRRAR